MGVVFAKTPKGHEEITSKAGGLTPRVRQVLIFVDGKRTVDELRGMLQSDDLQHTLGMLEEEGYIAISSVISPQGTVSAPAAALPPIIITRTVIEPAQLPAMPDPVRLQQARNFMGNTLKTFVGSLGTSSLLDRIENADGHTGLRGLYDEWYHAITTSRDGRREAEGLRTKLLLVI